MEFLKNKEIVCIGCLMSFFSKSTLFSFAFKNSLSFYYAFSQSFFINAQAKYLQAFIDDLENRPNVLEAYDEDIWIYIIDKAVVNRDDSINFNFRNGKTIRLRKNPKYVYR